MPYIKSAITRWETRNIEDAKGLIETFILIMFSDTNIFIYLIRLISQFINYPDGLKFINFPIIYVQVVALVSENRVKITPFYFYFNISIFSILAQSDLIILFLKQGGNTLDIRLFSCFLKIYFGKTPNFVSLGRQFQLLEHSNFKCLLR